MLFFCYKYGLYYDLLIVESLDCVRFRLLYIPQKNTYLSDWWSLGNLSLPPTKGILETFLLMQMLCGNYSARTKQLYTEEYIKSVSFSFFSA